MLKKIFYILIMMFLLVGVYSNVLATDTYTTTTTINGVTVNWQYELNDSNQIENLKCINPSDLTGNLIIPSTLDDKTVIGLKNEAFKGAINITSLTIPSSIKTIGYKAFEGCSNLENVNLGQVEKLSFNVFSDCPKLTKITIPKTLIDGPGDVNNGVFTGTTNLTSVTFEDGSTVIAAGILKDCTAITNVTIPSTVTKIGCRAFEKSGIKEIVFSNSLQEIEYYAFNDCSDLTKITILDNCTKIGGFNIQPTQDTVFQNHNENLTIYCYEGTKIAEYAIANNIKYVYLTKNTDETTDDNLKDDEETKLNNSNINNNSNNTNAETSNNKTDDTTAKLPIPQTGEKTAIFIVIAIVLISGVFSYFKFYKYKDIK